MPYARIPKAIADKSSISELLKNALMKVAKSCGVATVTGSLPISDKICIRNWRTFSCMAGIIH